MLHANTSRMRHAGHFQCMKFAGQQCGRKLVKGWRRKKDGVFEEERRGGGGGKEGGIMEEGQKGSCSTA